MQILSSGGQDPGGYSIDSSSGYSSMLRDGGAALAQQLNLVAFTDPKSPGQSAQSGSDPAGRTAGLSSGNEASPKPKIVTFKDVIAEGSISVNGPFDAELFFILG